MDWSVRRFPEGQGIAVGNIVFVSGCTGDVDGAPTPPGVEDQVTLALDKARRSLEAAGGRMDNIVKTFFLITSLDDYARVRQTETEYYEKRAPQLVTTPPAATLMVVPALARAELLVEYDVIGTVDRRKPNWEVKYFPEFWGGKELAYPHVPKEHAKFARSQTIGNLVIVSGCQALDHDTVNVETSDFAQQSRIVLDKIKLAMDEVGGSLDNVVKTNVFIKDAAMLQRYREVERAFFFAHAPGLARIPPASTVFVMSELPRREFLIEVEAFGVADATVPGWATRFHPGGADAASAASAGDLLFLSGCDGTDADGTAPDGIEGEVHAALDKVRAALGRAGSSLDKIVKTTLMLRRLADYPEMRAAEADYYRRHAPALVADPQASTFMQLPTIGTGDASFQIDVTAVL